MSPATGDRLTRELQGDDDSRRAALESLLQLAPAELAERIDRQTAAVLVGLLAHPRRTQQRQMAEAIGRLAPHAPQLHPALERALEAADLRLRWGAAFTLGHIAPAPIAIWPSVQHTMGLTDGDQRWAAAELACELARVHPRVASELRAVAGGTGAPAGPTTRKMALYCLRDLADPQLAAIARAALEDPDGGVRLAALSCLVRGGRDPVAAVRIARLTEADPEPGVRRAAAAALGRVAEPGSSAVDSLRAALGSDDPSLVRAARSALRLLGD